MFTLNEYLHTALPARRQERQDIRTTATDVLTSFSSCFDKATKTFPYAVRENGTPTAAPSYSFSTNAMVICAIRCVIGDLRSRAEGGYPQTSLLTPMLLQGDLDLSTSLRNKLRNIAANGIAALSSAVDANLKKGKLTESRTFGDNDALTISWILELLHKPEIDSRKPWLDFSTALINERLSNPEHGSRLITPGHESSPHALTLLRSVHAYDRLRQVSSISAINLESAKRWFESNVHIHLSYADIPDSSFDAPELVFSLEGLLLCERGVHGRERLLERVLSVIGHQQEHNPNLRPYRPITSDERGMALLPLTVEVFNSLLRILERLMVKRPTSSYQALARPIFRRYVQWLLGQRVTLETPMGSVTGWHSEHTYADRLIHVWETSQVLLFLAHYAAWLSSEIETEILSTGAFSVSRPKVEKYQPADEASASAAEPDQRVNVYRTIWKRFLTPRLAEASSVPSGTHYSALLYGPPGTGKTTFARYIAAILGWPMITITPSDFIVSGSQLVEERAKALFDALMELSRKVILFDEIDRLILDRSTPEYSDQEGIFQFMTPSMLPKFADLRAAERCIFVVATNFEERIDRAIKRRGRIDDKLLVLPPDADQRKRLIKDVIGKYKLMADDSSPEWAEVLEESVLHTYSELRESTKDAFESLPAGAPALPPLLTQLKDRAPDIHLASYPARFRKVGFDTLPTPDDEFRLIYDSVREARGAKFHDKLLREIYETIT